MNEQLKIRRRKTDVPHCRPFFEVFKAPAAAAALQPAADELWTVPELCGAYGWPRDLAGGGVIGILAMDGGYVDCDMRAFFAGIGQPMPDIENVVVMPGAGNFPGRHTKENADADIDPDVEIALDIQVAAASYYVATGKPARIRVYWTNTHLASMAAAIRQAVADRCTVFSISWGCSEDDWVRMQSSSGMTLAVELESVLINAAAAGMTVFAAAGDQEALDGGPDPIVSLPAACPHVVGCGGTTKPRNGEEIVWNSEPGKVGSGTGGGFSRLFYPQGWARNAPSGGGRIVPDVAANADKRTGYRIFVHGHERPTGGTSAVAPLYAGLFAAFGRGRGFINPQLWRNRHCFQDVVTGNNETYEARIGPDACTGLGVPVGRELARLFMAAARMQSAGAAA